MVYIGKEGGYLYVYLMNPYTEEWKGQNNGLEHCNSYYMKDKYNIDKIKIEDTFTTVSMYDKNIAENNLNYAFEFINNEEHYYSVHKDYEKLFLIHYNDDKSINQIKQSQVKFINKQPSLIISPEEFKECNYEYNFTVLDIDV